jgi:RHS repeat-associated protein
VTYSYSNPQHVHAVTALSSGNSYEYDANGNMVKRVIHGTPDVTWTINYDAENRTTSIGNAIDYGINYLYDGDGVRVGEYTNGTATYYFAGGAYEISGTVTGSNPVTFTETGVKKYYSIAGQMVAMDVEMIIPTVGNGLKYLLADHLGSMMAVVGDAGALLSEQRYLPFGGLRNLSGAAAITQTDFGYTGQRNNTYTGLMDYRARMYDPALGRFLQPDTIIPGMGNPQSLNRFSYVGNSPIGFNDPTGHMQACGINGEDACPGHDNPPPLPSSSGGDGGNGGNGGNHKDHDEDSTPENLVNTVVNSYIGGWATFGAAWSNTWNPNASIGSKIIGNYYMSAWLAGHVLLGVGTGYLAYAAYAAVSATVTGCTVSAPCGQNAIQTVTEVVDESSSVTRKTYQNLLTQAQEQYPNLAGKIQLHHIFPKYLGGDPKGPLVALDGAYHQVITNAFRAAWAYGQGAPLLQDAQQIMQQVYGNFPLP